MLELTIDSRSKLRPFFERYIFSDDKTAVTTLMSDVQFYEIEIVREELLDEICTRLERQQQDNDLIDLICKLPHDYFREKDIQRITTCMLHILTTTTTKKKNQILEFCANRSIVTLRIVCKDIKGFMGKLDSMLLREMARAGGAITAVDSELYDLLSYLVKHKSIEHLANVLIGFDEGISERAQIRLDKSFDDPSTTMQQPLMDSRLLQTLEQAEHLCMQDVKNKNDDTIKMFSALLSLRWNISMDKNTTYEYEKETKLLDWICPMLSHAATTSCSETASRYFMAVCKTQRHLKTLLDRSFLTKLIVAMLRRFDSVSDTFLHRSFEYLYVVRLTQTPTHSKTNTLKNQPTGTKVCPWTDYTFCSNHFKVKWKLMI